MKKLLCFVLLITALSTSHLSAQEKTDMHCIIYGLSGFSAGSVSRVKVDDAEKGMTIPLKDTVTINQLKKVEFCKSQAEIMNYMSYTGWNLVNILITNSVSLIYIYKKPYPKAEITVNKFIIKKDEYIEPAN